MTPNPPKDVFNFSDLKSDMSTINAQVEQDIKGHPFLALFWPSLPLGPLQIENNQEGLVLTLKKAGPEVVRGILLYMMSKNWLVPTSDIDSFLKKKNTDNKIGQVKKIENPINEKMGESVSVDLLNANNYFLKSVNNAIEEHLDDESFKSCHLAKKIFLCEMQLHRKLKKLANLSSSNYIRKYRLLRSLSFLQEDQYSVSEVCFKVGFRSLEYYSRSFKKEFGMSPSSFRKG